MGTDEARLPRHLPPHEPGARRELQRYVNEFAGRHNQRSLDTELQMRIMAQGLVGRQLRYKDLAVGRKRKGSHRAIAT